MKKLLKKVRSALSSRAKKLASEGYSVIPIQGDLSASEPKKPSVKWRAFQKHIADDTELRDMFESRAGAVGIVCGRVSQLVVIDFDDHLRYQRFCRHLPQYAESYTVKTRRGYHVYFRCKEKVPTHQFNGGDIKGEKSYVVAAPSVIGGFKYRVSVGCDALFLDKEGVERLLSYFHVRPAVALVSAARGAGAVDIDIARMYENLFPVIGRNNALYRCASVAKEDGISEVDTQRILLPLHIDARGESGHRFESYEDRYEEGLNSISSAFSSSVGRDAAGASIPNSVRERLLQSQGSSIVARLLDVFVALGWSPEKYFYMQDAICEGAKFGLNRKSVMSALTGEYCDFNGRHIIARRYVEYMDIGGLNSRKRGRRAQLVFQVPSVARLLSVLGVSWSPSDVLRRKDLFSGHAYRRALHREYVSRLSPQVSMAVMASRLGLNARTLRRYNVELGVHITARIGRFTLSWDTLKCLPLRERDSVSNQTPGYWLAVGESARFPSWRHIGAALLKRAGEAVYVCIRRPSVLSLGVRDPRPVVYESMSGEAFLRLRLLRGGGVDRAGVLERVLGALKDMKQRASRIRYEKVRLGYDSVSLHIADDKVAETINGYLYAQDLRGAEVRRPARRGVAYRMLKQFGEGNVYLALRDSSAEMTGAMARHAVRAGDLGGAIDLVSRSMA